MRIDEKIQLEKVNLERLKIETDANLQKMLESEMRLRQTESKKRGTSLAIDKFRHKVEQLKTPNHSTVSERTSVSLEHRAIVTSIELKKALESIAGLELTNANYEVVINLVKERYGNN